MLAIQVTIGLFGLGLLALTRSVAMPVAQGAGFFVGWAGAVICLGVTFYVLARVGLLVAARGAASFRARPTVPQRTLIARASGAVQVLAVALIAGAFVFGGWRIPLPSGGTTSTRNHGQYFESFKGRLLRPITRSRYEQLRTDDLRSALQFAVLAAAIAAVTTSGALKVRT